MTIQQLEYIVAVDEYRHFVRAAESCGVSQSTLSTLIKKLEEELDTVIFDRESHPIVPTDAGSRIISQARVALYNLRQLKEMTDSERLVSGGDVKIAVIPTVAPYIVPKLFGMLKEYSPSIRPFIFELQTPEILIKLSRAEIDMAIMATPLEKPNILEIPLYYEKLVAYVSEKEPVYRQNEIPCHELPTENLWLLKEGHCLRNQVLNLCEIKTGLKASFESGSIGTLVKIVDENGGCTVIPELHTDLLDEQEKLRVRPLVNPSPVREISLVIRNDYVRERILNEVASAVKKIIPDHMIDSGLKKFAIRL